MPHIAQATLAEQAVASATTCDIGAATKLRVEITGTTTITSFGTAANRIRFIRFSGALTLTHNGTSLILPGGANIVTAAGDTALATSDGSGNWRVHRYTRGASPPGDFRAGAFRVHRNAVSQTVTASQYTKLEFTHETFDKDGWFDNATNYRYTPLLAGTYLIRCRVASAQGTSGETCQAAVYKNGSSYEAGPYFSISSGLSAFVSDFATLIEMNGTTDYIEGFGWSPAGVTTLSGMFMHGYSVGP